MGKQHTPRQPEFVCDCNGEVEQHKTEPTEPRPRDSEVPDNKILISEIAERYKDVLLRLANK